MIQWFNSLTKGASVAPLSLDYNGTHHTILGSTYLSSVDPFGFNLYNPTNLWHNGKQYFTFRRNHNSSDGKPVINVYDGTTITSRVVSEVATLPADYHNNVTLVIDGSGYIYIVIEQHGGSPLIYKSNSIEDVSAFTIVAHDLPTLDYPHITYTSHGFLAYGRDNPSYDLWCATSSDMVTWTSRKMSIAITESGEPDFRHYPYIGKNWIQNDYLHVTAYKRTYDGVSEFRNIYGWKLKTPLTTDFGNVWYNDQETFNKDISVSPLTEAELNTNYQMWAAPNNEAQEGSGVYIDKYYSNQYRTDMSQERLISLSATWQDTPLQAGYILNYDNELWAIGDPSSVMKLRKMDLTGNTIQEGTPFYIPSDGILYQDSAFNYMFSYPQNINEVPKGSKFLICSPTDKDNGYNRESTTNNDVVCWEISKL